MVARLALVVATACGPSQPGDQAARCSQPEGPGIFPPKSAAVVLPMPQAVPAYREESLFAVTEC